MIYTVNYTKKNSFMRDPRLKQKNLEGELVSDARYVKPTVPKAVRNYVPHLHYKKGTFVINLKQVELNELVEKIGFYDSNGNLIKTAPLNNPDAPFWTHKKLMISLSGSGTTLDDDKALDKFWLKCFESDPRFQFSGDDIPPAMSSRVQFSVTKISENMSEDSVSNDESYEAMKLLTLNEDNFKKLVSVVRSMGVNVRNPEPKLVRDALLKKITTHKNNYVPGTSERNIEMFIRLMKASTKELELKELINKAKAKGVISKNGKNQYYYGELKLGSSLSKVEEFLKNEDNNEILNEFLEKTKD